MVPSLRKSNGFLQPGWVQCSLFSIEGGCGRYPKHAPKSGFSAIRKEWNVGAAPSFTVVRVHVVRGCAPICRKFRGGFFALGGLHHPPGRGGRAGPAWPCFERDQILRSDFSDFRSEIAKSRLRCIPPKTKNPALRPQVYILDYPVLRTKTPAHILIRGSRKAKAFPAAAAALRRTSSTPARRVPATLLRRAASSAPAPPPAASGVDLDGYPIHRPDSAAYRVLVDASRGALAATGCAFFPMENL